MGIRGGGRGRGTQVSLQKEVLGHGFGGDVPGSGVLARGPYGEDCLVSSIALPEQQLGAEHHDHAYTEIEMSLIIRGTWNGTKTNTQLFTYAVQNNGRGIHQLLSSPLGLPGTSSQFSLV